MSDSERGVGQEERDLAKAIFTAAAAAALAQSPFPDFGGMAQRAFNAARVFSEASAAKPKPQGVMDFL